MAISRSDFEGNPTQLTEADFAAIANQLECTIAAVKAVVAVESSGRGFLPDGRPKILFEAHVFGRLTDHRYDLSHPEISAPAWDRHLYKGGAAEYPRLFAAMELDETHALQSASYGLFQILGDNFRVCGYPDVEAFVRDCIESERGQMRGFVGFVRGKRLDDELRERRWADFARVYNGPRYAENHYDQKLAQAYARYA